MHPADLVARFGIGLVPCDDQKLAKGARPGACRRDCWLKRERPLTGE
jgi:hypothetical protein